MTKNCDFTLTLKVLHNGLGTPAVMRAECQVIDLKETQARTLTDGAKDSTLRELLTQRRDGAGKHLFGGGLNGLSVAGDAIRGRVRILKVDLLRVRVYQTERIDV